MLSKKKATTLRHKRAVRFAALLAASLVLTLPIARANNWWREVPPKSFAANPNPRPQDLPRAADPVQNIRFTIYAEGIRPSEIKVPKGTVGIMVEDRSRKSDGLVVEKENGNLRVAAGQVKRAPDFWRGRNELKLTPGTYRVHDASNPANEAKLVVTP